MVPQDNVTLRGYLERLLSDLERRIETRFQLQAEALNKAEHAMERRLEGMNELRGAMSDQSNKMVTRAELDGIEKSLQAKIETLSSLVSSVDKRIAVQSALISTAVGIIMGAASLLVSWFKN